MDEIWERAVKTALAGQTEPETTTRVLTLDGAVKCVKGHLPRPEILERFKNLEHLSIASIGVSSLDQFPRLGNLKKLVLSDNRISGGLEFLVQAGLGLLRDLDLSNNRIQLIDDLVPLAQLKLVSLDLYKCPVTLVEGYRSKVFGLVKSLKYLDKMDAEENERPESDDDEEEEEDPGSYKKDGEERPNVMSNGHSEKLEKVDEEETETGRQSDGVCDYANGLRDEHLNMDEEENDESDEEDWEDEYEPDGFIIGDEDVGDSEEEVDLGVPHGNELLRNIIFGEGDGHEQDEDDEDSWEEEEQGSDDGEEEDEEYGAGRLAQSMAEAIQVDEEEESEDDEVQAVYSIASSNLKRKRDEDDDGDYISSSSDNSDGDGDGSSDDDE